MAENASRYEQRNQMGHEICCPTYHTNNQIDLEWWQKAVFYQIYPRSFQDTDGDGIGDLQGIIKRLDYLVELGIDAVWISPIFPSPMADFGYDVSDYCDIDSVFGDLETFDRLIAAAHERNLKVILDYVPNHSSDQHRWFLESRSSRNNPKRHWYIWQDAEPDGSPPSNWESLFGGSAWAWDEHTGQYYLHTFLPEQPDLNWRNPEVVEAMHNVIRFWLDRGVDGLRVDAIPCLMKDPAFPDNPRALPDSHWAKLNYTMEPRFTMFLPETVQKVREMRQVFDEYDDRVHIGETGAPELAKLMPYYGESLDGYDIPFNFTTLFAPWDPSIMRSLIEVYYRAIPPGGWPNFVFGNHDIHRLAVRYGFENHCSAGMLLLTLWGIPTLYYGDEIGMTDVSIPVQKRIDPWGINQPETELGRDPERTPMQWDSSENAGFTTGEPWLPLADDYERVNVAAQTADQHSTLNFYRRLLRLRRELPALHNGSLTFVDNVPADVLAYVREAGGVRLFIAINFGPEICKCEVSPCAVEVRTLLSTQFAAHKGTTVTLQPHESILLQIE